MEKVTEDTRRAAQPVIRTIPWSFCRIERSRNQCILATFGMSFVVDDPRQRQQLGAHREARPLYGVHVNRETHFVVFQVELNAAAALGESIAFPDQQDAGAFQALEYLGQPLAFRIADENDLTTAQVFLLNRPAD